ncbi:MAG TPA: PD-(D/E)XK nuclease family protein [Thermoleophilia bacterium]|nr:PD-(D/E)XK nuclease family protein [Thermoleophilia bacterium]
MTQFKNDHLSFSRLTRYESCPLSYRLHYIDKHQPEPGIALRFGKVIHAVLERLVREAVDDERSGPLSEDRALTVFRDAWTADGLTGIELFQEGIEILQRFVREQGVIEHRDVLAVEKEFRLPVGPFTVLGFIDRVDCVDDETVEVIDYKTNRQLFTRDEVDTSLQMSLYHVAARKLWPWAKKVKLTFWMLRHGVRQETERTPEQLDAALAYVETLGRQTEVATSFPARLNTNCPYCDHRAGCPAYAEALKGTRDFVCPDLADLEAVAKEREEVARLAKVLHARKEELEAVLKAHLKEQEELVLGGVRYRMFNATKLEYPLAATIEKFGQATGRSWNDLVGDLAVIDNKALEDLLKKLAKQTDKNRVALLKAELEASARKTQIPRFWAKEVSA